MAEHKRCIKLNTGAEMPIVGLGTFLSKPGEVTLAIKAAIALGYKHIDCAAGYDNEKEIGHALHEVFAEGKVKREDIFITSKLRASAMQPSGILEQFNKTLADLQLAYLDLYLVHQPVACTTNNTPQRGFGLHEVWRVFETIYESGKAKAIGVSNFPTVVLNDLLNYAKVVPAVQQIERTPYLTQTTHIKYCLDNGIQITAYGPLGAPGLMATRRPNFKPLLNNATVTKLAEKYKKTVAQVLIRWQVQSNMVVIPKSIKPERIKENFEIWDFVLAKEDMEALDGLNENLRAFDQDWHTVPTFT